ncbi:MAG: glucose 1-dehydrogenase [Alphaproteobacteria bacterium]|jgi:NAD(P)-dependent dehydrogenase (short-subunit alcohol dehydrogenase family)|nr:glucose 1-dehydrogenase [Alphaproteobacteria bacterium]
MTRLDGKVALITGAAGGIGREAARLMALEGASVVLTDIRAPEGRAVADDIAAKGGGARFMALDVTREADWEQTIESVMDEAGALDVLVNNAGIAGAGIALDEMDLETWRRCLAICLDGVFLGVKHGIRAMRRGGGGSIINVSSIAGKIGIPTSGNYCAAKGGVKLLTKTAALECAGGEPLIRVNSVHPGFIDTDMVAGAIQRRGPWFRELVETSVPMGRLGEARDIAEGIVYLASDAAKFVTGSELVIDGGYLAR